MKVDILFGKRISGSFYHVKGNYLKRLDVEGTENLPQLVGNSISEILTSGIELPDSVVTLLNRINADITTIHDISESSPIDQVVNDINSAIASLSYLEYELYAIIRNDVDSAELDISKDRSYAMTKQFNSDKVLGINNFTYGISTVYDDLANANLTSMVMDYLESERIKLNEEDEELINIQNAIEEFRMMQDRGDANMMDVSKVLNMLEKIGYHFIMVISPESYGVE